MKHSKARRRGRQNGAAILMAMLTVLLVATLASAALWQQWRAVEVESAERTRAQPLKIKTITSNNPWMLALLFTRKPRSPQAEYA